MNIILYSILLNNIHESFIEIALYLQYIFNIWEILFNLGPIIGYFMQLIQQQIQYLSKYCSCNFRIKQIQQQDIVDSKIYPQCFHRTVDIVWSYTCCCYEDRPRHPDKISTTEMQRDISWQKKNPSHKRWVLCWHYLSSRAVTRQVLSTRMSLTSVFGMGTGGPSLLSIPTIWMAFNHLLCQSFESLNSKWWPVPESNRC